MSSLEKFDKAFDYFKSSYSAKMGGTQTVILPNGKSKFFDDRQYYKGRGAKYNSGITHEEKGEVKISKADYLKYIETLNAITISKALNIQAAKDKEERVLKAKAEGIYSIDTEGCIELSNYEQANCLFDPQRLANTLKISVKDASLLKSTGKTYVFAKSTTGKTYQLYHASLLVNDLNIYISVATPYMIAKFNPTEWQAAPYAHEVGQTDNPNHFVC